MILKHIPNLHISWYAGHIWMTAKFGQQISRPEKQLVLLFSFSLFRVATARLRPPHSPVFYLAFSNTILLHVFPYHIHPPPLRSPSPSPSRHSQFQHSPPHISSIKELVNIEQKCGLTSTGSAAGPGKKTKTLPSLAILRLYFSCSFVLDIL